MAHAASSRVFLRSGNLWRTALIKLYVRRSRPTTCAILTHCRILQPESHANIAPYTNFAGRIVEYCPNAIQPYLKLTRFDKPTGTLLLYWPCAWSISMASSAGQLPDIKYLLMFGLGAFIMRGAGCTINDIWDRKLDAKVERTKDRPLARGDLSTERAVVFLGGQLGLGCLIILQLNWYSILLGASSLALVTTYPLVKRFTNYPQLVLGFTFNWGALLGWSAVHGQCDFGVCLPLYISGICWTMVYDTIYALQDKKDDKLLGIGSTAAVWGNNVKPAMGCFALGMATALTWTGIVSGLTWPYFTSVAASTAYLLHQISALDVDNCSDGAAKFSNNVYVGLVIFLGICAGNLLKKSNKTDKNMEANKPQQSLKT